MDNLVSKIPKEKLKTGKLYKTQLPNVKQPSFRVWMGHGWSIGTEKPRNKEWPIYFTKAHESIQESLIVVNNRATPFKSEPSTSNNQTFQFKSAFLKVDPKPLRYLNRP